MTVTENPSTPATPATPATRLPRLRGSMSPRSLLILTGVVMLLSVVAEIANAGALTSSGTFGAALRGAVPIGLAGLGGLYAERTGVVNIGLEGMMILGTWMAGWAGWQYGVWWGVAFGVLGGALGGLLHAVATVSFGVDHIISGVAINIMAGGLARYLSTVVFTTGTGGGQTQSPQVVGDIGTASIPVLSGGVIGGWQSPDLLGALERQDIFLLSDIGGMLKGVTANLSWLTVIAIALIPFTWWLLWRTPLGLRMRSVGERPAAAESLGVNVYAMKYLGVTISGAMAGLAGSFLVMEGASIYREGQTGGRGFIGLAATLFGNYRPGGVGIGATLFGFADALQLRSSEAVFALLLAISIAVAIAAVVMARRRRWTPAGVLLATSIGAMAWYLTADDIPTQFIFFTPHLLTLVVLTFASQRLRIPAADGMTYRRGQSE